MKVKLCGVRTVRDALLCARAGADEIGVVFAKSSKRRVSVELAREIRESLPTALSLVGVFLDATPVELEEVLSQVRLSALQLHGALPSPLPELPIYVALPVADAGSLQPIAGLTFAARILLDSPKGGGSGQAFPWALAREARQLNPRQLFVAGGLTPSNVGEAIELARPDGVDVASGIEGPDGFKDEALVRAFVGAVKERRQ